MKPHFEHHFSRKYHINTKNEVEIEHHEVKAVKIKVRHCVCYYLVADYISLLVFNLERKVHLVNLKLNKRNTSLFDPFNTESKILFVHLHSRDLSEVCE